MRYRPFTNRHTKHIVQTIKENIEFCNIDQITIDTLDICHLIGRIEQLEDKNHKLRIKNKKSNKRIDKAIEYLTDEGVCILNKGMKENEQLVWTWENYYDLLDILKGVDKE